MARSPVFPAEEKVRIVLSILAGEITVAEAARRAKVSEQWVGNWKRQFLEAGKSGLGAGKAGPSTREQQLEAEDLEVIRIEEGMPTTRFCLLIGVPERTGRRHQARARAGHRPKRPWPHGSPP